MNSLPSTLIVAPYIGEFGWELMNWQGRVRWTAVHGRYRRIVVVARPDRRALYASLSPAADVVFCPVGEMDLPGEACEDRRIDKMGSAVDPTVLRGIAQTRIAETCEAAGIAWRDADVLMPDYRGTIWPTSRPHQLFVELRRPGGSPVDVVLVPRTRSIAPERNLNADWWESLAGRLRGADLTVETYRGPLDEAIRLLSRARLAVGASTGGLHLAGLCRCPHYVWGCGAEARWTALGITNRQRYETVWNPLGTPCRYDECGWRPSVDYVVDQVLHAMATIALPSGGAARSWEIKPKWRIKRRLARLLDAPVDGSPWPWRLRQLVRERLV